MAAEPAEAEPAVPPPPSAHETLLVELKDTLGDAVVGHHVTANDLWVRVKAGGWRRTAEACRDLGFDYFCFLSGIDWMPHTWPNPKVADAEGDAEEGADEAVAPEPEPAAEPGAPTHQTGVAGGDTRFQVLARLYSTSRHLGLTLKADLDGDDPRVETWSGVYPGADWHERETWEMYGFTFDGHPSMGHLYLPGEFEGFPLRKDFPLLSREVKPWPGLVDVEGFPPGTDDEATADATAAEEGSA